MKFNNVVIDRKKQDDDIQNHNQKRLEVLYASNKKNKNTILLVLFITIFIIIVIGIYLFLF